MFEEEEKVFSRWDPLSEHNIESLFATGGGNFKRYLVFVAFVKKYLDKYLVVKKIAFVSKIDFSPTSKRYHNTFM